MTDTPKPILPMDGVNRAAWEEAMADYEELKALLEGSKFSLSGGKTEWSHKTLEPVAVHTYYVQKKS